MLMRRATWTFVVALLSLIAGQTAAMAEARIGTAVRIVKDVTADARALLTGDGVNQNETVEVKADSLGELKLDDNTKLALGPGARLRLDKFVYDPAKSEGDISVSLVKGAFRFVTGNAAKNDYKIRTPNAAISVRGTVFDIYIDDAGVEYLLLQQGSIEVCRGDGSDRTTCRTLQNVCNVIRVSPQDGVSNPQGWRERSDQQISFAIAFPFVLNPPTVDPVVYNTAANIEANSCTSPQTPGPQRADYVPPSTPSYPAGSAGPGSYPPPSSFDPGDGTPPSTPPTLPVSWTGIYIGVHGGGTQTSSSNEAYCSDGGDTGGSCGGDSGSFQEGSLDFSGANGGGGVQAGGRAQFGILVVGFEIDVTRMEGTNSETYASANSEFFYDTTVSQSMRWFGTTRATAGIAFGNILVFVTGGVAVADVEYGVGVQGFGNVQKSVTQVGWTGGGGFEIGLGLISFRGEYLHFDLGDETLAYGTGGLATTASQFDNSGNTFRFGINFRLN
jgi:opacity protein-like surface antigen